jgi:putative acetyltransferase
VSAPGTSTIEIRPERHEDAAAVRQVNERAFGRAEEALLVGTLHAAHGVTLSLVAEDLGHIVGHILFSPVWIESHANSKEAVGLGPLAVLPERQGQGIGALLVRSGLERLRYAGVEAVIVLGHPAYYPRFGFVPAGTFGLRWEFDAPAEAFMACELIPGALGNCPGVVRFRPEFAEL